MVKKTGKKKVAVFDIDGTIFRSSLLIEMVEMLIEEKVFPERARDIYLKEHKNWLDRKEGYDEYIMAVVEAFNRYIRIAKEKELLAVIDKVIKIHRDRVYRFTRDLIKNLKKKKYFLLAISHSPKYITDRFAEKLGFDKVYGRLLVIDERGYFTGETFREDLIMNKAKILERAIGKHNLTLEGSVGVGDTESDTSFLSMVQDPICFNPNSGLYKAAVKNGWRVVVERKDVIYQIDNGEISEKITRGN